MGYYLVFCIQQYCMREEMMEKIIKNLPDKNLTVIQITNENRRKLKWVEKNKEFKFNGKLYDLARVITQGDTSLLYCVNDRQEEQLIANLEEHIQKDNDSQIPKNKRISNIQERLIKDYFSFEYILELDRTAREFIFKSTSENLVLMYPEIKTPPPKNSI
jgi:hypothetical protein